MDSEGGKLLYPEAVPAAQRTMVLLEHLAALAPRGATLQELSRALGISPSSLLALLTTLRKGGYVVRDEADRYHAGLALATLGAAAALRLELHDAFEQAAAPLLRETGETVLLWRVEVHEAVVVAAREGWRPVRYVPRIGQRISLAGSPLADALAHAPGVPGAAGDLEPGVRALVIALAEMATVGAPALLGVAGPPERLRAESLWEALRAAAAHLRTLGGSATPAREPVQQSGALVGEELRDFLAEPLIASLGYLNEDGYPSTVPVWFDWDGAAFWLLPGPGARWAAHLQRAPRVSLTVGEAGPPLRRVNAEGVVTVVEDPARARQVHAAMGRKYAAAGAADPAWQQRPRVAVRVDPMRLVSWRGLTSHARARAGQGVA